MKNFSNKEITLRGQQMYDEYYNMMKKSDFFYPFYKYRHMWGDISTIYFHQEFEYMIAEMVDA